MPDQSDLALPVLKIESCRDCPRFKTRKVRHWTMGNGYAFEYRCTQAGRCITPNDGVKPPPEWCPKRT